MKNYFAVYLAPIDVIKDMMANMTEEQAKLGMEVWNKWMQDNAGSLIDGGAPLGKTKRVTAGGINDATNDITGYSIVEAESHEEAANLFLNHPHLQLSGASIDILEVTKIPGA